MAETKFTTHAVTNKAKGMRGLHGRQGSVFLEPGETRDVELEDGELASAKATGHFGFGKAGSQPKGDEQPAAE